MMGVLCGSYPPELCFFYENLECVCLGLRGWAGQSCHCLVVYEASRQPTGIWGLEGACSVAAGLLGSLAWCVPPSHGRHRSPGRQLAQHCCCVPAPIQSGMGRVWRMMCMVVVFFLFYFKIKGNVDEVMNLPFFFLKLQST